MFHIYISFVIDNVQILFYSVGQYTLDYIDVLTISNGTLFKATSENFKFYCYS